MGIGWIPLISIYGILTKFYKCTTNGIFTYHWHIHYWYIHLWYINIPLVLGWIYHNVKPGLINHNLWKLGGYFLNSHNHHNLIVKWYPPPQYNSRLGFINPGLILDLNGWLVSSALAPALPGAFRRNARGPPKRSAGVTPLLLWDASGMLDISKSSGRFPWVPPKKTSENWWNLYISRIFRITFDILWPCYSSTIHVICEKSATSSAMATVWALLFLSAAVATELRHRGVRRALGSLRHHGVLWFSTLYFGIFQPRLSEGNQLLLVTSAVWNSLETSKNWFNLSICDIDGGLYITPHSWPVKNNSCTQWHHHSNLTGTGPLCSCDCCSVAQRRPDERKNQMGRGDPTAVEWWGLESSTAGKSPNWMRLTRGFWWEKHRTKWAK